MKNKIFEVDLKGFKQLQEGKPKWFIVRELLQNALDEEISKCELTLSYSRGTATITVTDDSPEGFRDLADVYTLFKDTYKRTNAQKRGRFNFGEKQVLVLADSARVLSTKGGWEFDLKSGNKSKLKIKRKRGSEVVVKVKMTREEFDRCESYADSILVPDGIEVTVNSRRLEYKEPYKSFDAKLKTELKEDDRMRTVTRETEVDIHLPTDNVSFVYEMGIPICEIDCDYSIDVQQKVPLSTDRDTVSAKYLKDLYGLVLNHVEIDQDQASSLWVRDGFTSDKTTAEKRKEVIEARFGEKALIANTMDPYSMDEAISNGYNVVHGSEMSKEEWAKVRQDGSMVSTSAQFKRDITQSNSVKPTEDMKKIADLTKKIAKDTLNLNVSTRFYKSPGATVKASFGDNTVSYNVAKFSASEWKPDAEGYVKESTLDLIIHELGHSGGWHYEHSYHDALTKIASKLALIASRDSNYLKIDEA